MGLTPGLPQLLPVNIASVECCFKVSGSLIPTYLTFTEAGIYTGDKLKEKSEPLHLVERVCPRSMGRRVTE